jgi:hypothetical protein
MRMIRIEGGTAGRHEQYSTKSANVWNARGADIPASCLRPPNRLPGYVQIIPPLTEDSRGTGM